jgi:hypothetical protein
VPALALHSFSQAIEIPTSLRDQPLDTWQTSARLTTLLSRSGIRVLGDLHGRKVVDFAWEKNCGPKTLYELDLLARRARFRNRKAFCNSHRGGRVHPSHNGMATGSETVTAKTQEDAASFAIPESICHLSFKELPITRRLANVVHSMGARSLGDLNGRTAFELLQCKACGWGTISEVQQLIDRAVSGEFDIRQIEETDAAAELLNLLEQGLMKLPLRERQFVLARIGAQMGTNRSPGGGLLYLSYAEIGRRYGLTRARAHKVCANTLDGLKRIWGPRVPRLLEVIKWRCLSTISPLTPQLLEQWVDSAEVSAQRAMTHDNLSSCCRLSAEAHVRLIAALDKSIPCWLETHHKPRHIDGSVGQFDLALARIVRVAGGRMTTAEAYGQLARWGGRDYRLLTVEKFLRMLCNVKCTRLEPKDSEIRSVRLSPLNGGVLPAHGPGQNGKLSSARRIDSDAPAIQPGLSVSLQYRNNKADDDLQLAGG